MSLKGRSALITGSTQGLGLAMAERLASLAYGEPTSQGVPSSLHYKATGHDVSVQLREVAVDAPVQPEVWAVQCPEGAQVLELSCEEP